MPLDGGQKKNKMSGINFAPAEPLRLLKTNGKSYEESTFAQIARELYLSVKNEQIEMRRQIAEIGRLMSNLRSGKMRMMRDPVHGTYALIKPLPTRTNAQKFYNVPLAQINSSQLTSIWSLSRPKATVRHFGNTTRAQIQHALMEQVIDHYDHEIFDEWFNQQESLSMMDYGCAIIRPFYDQNKSSVFHLEPIIENSIDTLFDGKDYCRKCKQETELQFVGEMPFCAECGSFDVLSSPAQQVEKSTIIGANQIIQGDLGAELLDVPACNWDMRGLVQDSPYFEYRSEVSLRAVESVLGIEISADEAGADYFLNIINAIGIRGGSVEGYGRDEFFTDHSQMNGTALMSEAHFKPEMYAGMRLEKSERTISGETIPAKTPLEQVFPDGLQLIGFNEMDIIAAAFNEPRREISSVYHIQSHSGVGKGTADAIEISEQINLAHTAAIESMKRYGAGSGYWYDKDVLTGQEAKKLLKPGALVGLSLAGRYESIDRAIGQVNHSDLSAQNLVFVAQLTNLLNMSFQTTDFTAGVADSRVDINTARGQEMLHAQNQQRTAAPLRLKGWSRARVAEQLLSLFRENIQIPKFFGTGDKFALTKGRFITGADIPETVKCDFVENSEIPTNNFTEREAASKMMQEAANFGVPFAELMQINPRIAMWWGSKFGVDDMPLMNQMEVLIVCQERLDDLKEIVAEADTVSQISGFAPNPSQAAPALVEMLARPLFMDEENHTVKASVLSAYLDDDEVKDWSPLMREAVKALINRHYELERDARLRLQSLEQEGQLALAARAMQMQSAIQQPQIEAEQTGQMLEKGADFLGKQIEREEDYNREQERAAIDHERAMELEKMRQKNRRTGK